MNFSFMRIEDLVMSGDGFYQSMAYHAYQSLSWQAFWLQCACCVSAIGLAYWLRHRWNKARLERYPDKKRLNAWIDVVGAAATAATLMGLAMLLGELAGLDRLHLMVVWKVLSLTLWVMAVRLGAWVFRHVMHPHELLRIFLLLIEWALVLAMVLTFFGLLVPLRDAVDLINFSVGDQVFKGANIVGGVMLAVVALTVAGQLAQLVDWILSRSSQRHGVQPNDALILTRLFSVGIFVLTAVAVLISSGIEPTTIAAFAGAMGIGLGFGLQEVVINFIAGLYILLERAMKVGDYVTLNQINGRVVQLSSRAIVIRDGVGTESLIPNSSVTKGVLQNHTLSNDDYRVSFGLKIASIADFTQVRELVLRVLRAHPRVLQDKALGVLIVSILQNEVALEISCWINDLHNGQKGLISDLYFDIAMALREQSVALASGEDAGKPWSLGQTRSG